MRATSTDDVRLANVCKAIAIYVARRPYAADTALGVFEQWLGELHPRVSQQLVERALALLVQQGELRRYVLAGGTELYASARHNRGHVR